jgi:hypothetical protein
MAERTAPVDNYQSRLEKLRECQHSAHTDIARKFGTYLADIVTEDRFNGDLSLESPKLISLNPESNDWYGGYTQEGTYRLCYPIGGEGYIEEKWQTEVTHHAGGIWQIKTELGDRKFTAFSNGKEIEVKVTVPFTDYLPLINSVKNEPRWITNEKFEHIAAYLNNLDYKGMMTVTFSSIPGKSEIHLPL